MPGAGALPAQGLPVFCGSVALVAGKPIAGVKPDINTIGVTESGSVLPNISAESSVFDYQLCGEDDEI